MGWLWGEDDPLKQLDPSLRAFLEKEGQNHDRSQDARLRSEAARERSAAASRPPQLPQTEAERPQPNDAAPNTWRSFFGLSVGDTLISAQAKHEEAKANVESSPPTTQDQLPPKPPPESLFPDGRYASIWSSYRSERENAEAGKSDQEKLHDILHGYRARQADLKRAAMENCVEEQWNIHECFKSGGVSARMTMCRAENRELESCVRLQTRFLKALGYASMWERSEEESERIQGHADELYLKMKEQEREIEAAKAEGRAVPEFAPLIRRHEDGTAMNQKDAEQASANEAAAVAMPTMRSYESLPGDLKDRIMKGRFEGLEGAQLEVAKRELEADLTMHSSLASQFDQRMRQERRERLARAARGQERISDKFRRWLDFNDYTALDEEEARRAEEVERKRREQTARAEAQAA